MTTICWTGRTVVYVLLLNCNGGFRGDIYRVYLDLAIEYYVLGRIYSYLRQVSSSSYVCFMFWSLLKKIFVSKIWSWNSTIIYLWTVHPLLPSPWSGLHLSDSMLHPTVNCTNIKTWIKGDEYYLPELSIPYRYLYRHLNLCEVAIHTVPASISVIPTRYRSIPAVPV